MDSFPLASHCLVFTYLPLAVIAFVIKVKWFTLLSFAPPVLT